MEFHNRLLHLSLASLSHRYRTLINKSLLKQAARAPDEAHRARYPFSNSQHASAFFIRVMPKRKAGLFGHITKQLADSGLQAHACHAAVMPASDHSDPPLQLLPGGFPESPADLFRRSWRSSCCRHTAGPGLTESKEGPTAQSPPCKSSKKVWDMVRGKVI